jgi:hypothetical protein
LSHLTSCTPTKSNLCLTDSLAAAVRDPDPYRLLTFHLMSVFHCLGHTKVSIKVQAFLCEWFIRWYFLRRGVVSI